MQLLRHLKLAARASLGYFLLTMTVYFNFGLRLRNIELSPTETVLSNVISISNTIHLMLLIFLVLAFFSSIFNVVEIKGEQIVWMRFVTLYLTCSALSFGIYWLIADQLKEDEYAVFVSENRILIDAIEKYTADQEHPPHALIDLYPAYYDWEATVDNTVPEEPELLISIPYRSLDEESARRVTYAYRSYTGDINSQRTVSWELIVSIDRGSFQPVRLVYNPEEIYPIEDAVRIGYPREWAILGDF